MSSFTTATIGRGSDRPARRIFYKTARLQGARTLRQRGDQHLGRVRRQRRLDVLVLEPGQELPELDDREERELLAGLLATTLDGGDRAAAAPLAGRALAHVDDDA